MSRPSIVPDVAYFKTGDYRTLRAKLRYFEHREGSIRIQTREQPSENYRWTSWEDIKHLSDDALPPNTTDPRTGERWIDHGLGGHWWEIAANCDEFEGDRILARSYVISPDPELMHEVDEERRLELLAETTEDVMHTLYDRQKWGRPQFSFVMHDRQTNSHDEDGNPQEVQQMLHSHVITPGTHFGRRAGRRESQPTFVSAERLHEISRDIFERNLEREIGQERFQAIMEERERNPEPLEAEIAQPEIDEPGPTYNDFGLGW